MTEHGDVQVVPKNTLEFQEDPQPDDLTTEPMPARVVQADIAADITATTRPIEALVGEVDAAAPSFVQPEVQTDSLPNVEQTPGPAPTVSNNEALQNANPAKRISHATVGTTVTLSNGSGTSDAQNDQTADVADEPEAKLSTSADGGGDKEPPGWGENAAESGDDDSDNDGEPTDISRESSSPEAKVVTAPPLLHVVHRQVGSAEVAVAFSVRSPENYEPLAQALADCDVIAFGTAGNTERERRGMEQKFEDIVSSAPLEDWERVIAHVTEEEDKFNLVGVLGYLQDTDKKIVLSGVSKDDPRYEAIQAFGKPTGYHQAIKDLAPLESAQAANLERIKGLAKSLEVMEAEFAKQLEALTEEHSQQDIPIKIGIIAAPAEYKALAGFGDDSSLEATAALTESMTSQLSFASLAANALREGNTEQAAAYIDRELLGDYIYKLTLRKDDPSESRALDRISENFVRLLDDSQCQALLGEISEALADPATPFETRSANVRGSILRTFQSLEGGFPRIEISKDQPQIKPRLGKAEDLQIDYRGPILLVEEHRVGNARIKVALHEHTAANVARLAEAVRDCDIIAIERPSSYLSAKAKEAEAARVTEYISSDPDPQLLRAMSRKIATGKDGFSFEKIIDQLKGTGKKVVFIDIDRDSPERQDLEASRKMRAKVNEAIAELIPTEEARALCTESRIINTKSLRQRDVVLAAQLQELGFKYGIGDAVSIGVLMGSAHHGALANLGEEASLEMRLALEERVRLNGSGMEFDQYLTTPGTPEYEEVTDKLLLSKYVHAFAFNLERAYRNTFDIVEHLTSDQRNSLLDAISQITNTGETFGLKARKVRQLLNENLTAWFGED